MNKTPTILAIDTSCDETSVAITNGFMVIANVISSSANLHKEFGGVMPTLAKLEHEKRILPTIQKSFRQTGISWQQIDYIAVTTGPGLAIALGIGIKTALELAIKHKKDIISVNHMEGHLLSPLAHQKQNLGFEILTNSLGLLLSGGHTEIIKILPSGYEKLGQTLDDACGEAFDKAARLLGLGYPGGAALAKIATENRKKYSIKTERTSKGLIVSIENNVAGIRPALTIPLSNKQEILFSFSGLKTAFWRLTASLDMAINNKQEQLSNYDLTKIDLPKDVIEMLCVLFESAASLHICNKLELALKQEQPKYLLFGGGVVANTFMRGQIRLLCKKYNCKLLFPYSRKLFGDNAAMIGIAAYRHFLAKDKYVQNSTKLQPEAPNFLERNPSWSLKTV